MAIQLRSIEGFHVGGERRHLNGLPVEYRVLAQGGNARPVDMNGDHWVGQMYAQWFRQVTPALPWTIVLWHGGGMTGANWDSTPDGRPGWLQRLLEAGLDVCVCDAVERGRSGWALWPSLYGEAALMRSHQEGWDMFRIGPADGYASDPSQRRAHVGQQFPVDAYDTFTTQWVPRWSGHEAMTLAAYGQLLERVGPCVLIGHSQGGGFALQAAATWPERLRAVVALEPSGAPAQTAEAHANQGPAQLVVWGDHIDRHPQWQRYRETLDAHVRQRRERGGAVDVLELAQAGLPGHSHFPMLDHNSDAVLERILDWVRRVTPAPTHRTP